MRLLTDDASVDPKAVGLSTRTAVEIEAELARQACTVRLMGVGNDPWGWPERTAEEEGTGRGPGGGEAIAREKD